MFDALHCDIRSLGKGFKGSDSVASLQSLHSAVVEVHGNLVHCENRIVFVKGVSESSKESVENEWQ